MHVVAIISLIALATLSIVRAAPTASVEDLVIIEGLVPYNGTEDSLYKRTTRDYSGVNCNKECLGTPGGGPNEADCVVLIEQKLFPRGEKKFAVQPNTAGSITYRSCLLLLNNPSQEDVVIYQFNLWGSVANFLRQECNAAHGASFGQCTFSDNVVGGSPSVQLANVNFLT